jgi:hyperosmotically inducible protein
MKNPTPARLLAVAALATLVMACTPTRTQKSAGETIDDAVITTKVKAALVESPTASARQIDVETYRGTVQLNGFVDSAAESTAAAAAARRVEGVTAVKNNLTVRGGPRTTGEAVDDATLTAKVKAALVADPVTQARDINVESQRGVVQLSGFVDDATQKNKAGEIARAVAGVSSVDNELEVKKR